MDQPTRAEALFTILSARSWVSDPIRIDQDRIDRFADVTGDRQFIHIDPVRAAATPFGGTIAHGFLTLSLIATMAQSALPPIESVRMAMNYGLNGVRFLTPVKVDSVVRGHFAVKTVRERQPGQVQVCYDVSVAIEGLDKPALVAELLLLMMV